MLQFYTLIKMPIDTSTDWKWEFGQMLERLSPEDKANLLLTINKHPYLSNAERKKISDALFESLGKDTNQNLQENNSKVKMTIDSEFLTEDLSKKVHEAIKEESRIWKVWEHNGWGDRISIAEQNEDGSYGINGNRSIPRLSKGDYLVCKGKDKGEPCYLRAIITDIEYKSDPPDLFFGIMVIVNVCNEDGADINP